jgi:hypothetical protein
VDDAFFYISPTTSQEPHPVASAFANREPINQEFGNYEVCTNLVEQSDRDTDGMGVMLYYGGEGDDLTEAEYK